MRRFDFDQCDKRKLWYSEPPNRNKRSVSLIHQSWLWKMWRQAGVQANVEVGEGQQLKDWKQKVLLGSEGLKSRSG